jgi:hypothetical protein
VEGLGLDGEMAIRFISIVLFVFMTRTLSRERRS